VRLHIFQYFFEKGAVITCLLVYLHTIQHDHNLVSPFQIITQKIRLRFILILLFHMAIITYEPCQNRAKIALVYELFVNLGYRMITVYYKMYITTLNKGLV